MQRRLASETSPYLLHHACNPVDWFPWSDEAFSRAKKEDKPVLLSIGYSACHWCHVMERESFEDKAIAAQMNENFICIKVDREERPDIDELYMSATVALTGSGGWPMTLFLTPEGQPFFAGTYFPPHDRAGRPGLSSLMSQISTIWKDDRKSLLTQAAELTVHVKNRHQPHALGGISENSIRAACRALSQEFDPGFGGFGGAPKFPATAALGLLLRYHRRTGQAPLLKMVLRTLDGMMSGGLYDQLGGGFCRYSVDSQWLIPHFEKMLYDNAQLADTYIEAFQATGHAPYRRIARETLDYIIREMQSPQGPFFSSSDADSEGIEGKYFVWDQAQVRALVPEPAATHFCEFYGITLEGNFEGKSVLSTRRSLEDVARILAIAEAKLLESLEMARTLLFQGRSTRVAPEVDDKILTSWNGLMIRALANGARTFHDERYLKAAQRAADFLCAPASAGEGMRREDGGLFRTTRSGRSHIHAFLEDYAFMAEGLLALYEAGGGKQYLEASLEFATRMLEDFSDPSNEGALFSTMAKPQSGEPPLLTRAQDGRDSALASANASACLLLARLSVHTNKPNLRTRAESIARAFSAPIKRTPRAYCAMLSAIDFLLDTPLEIVLTGSAHEEATSDLALTVAATFLPQRIETRLYSSEDESALSPLTQNRFSDKPSAYLCQNQVCAAPVHNSGDLQELLRQVSKREKEMRKSELGVQLLPGRATKEGTLRFQQSRKLPPRASSQIQDFTVSRIGLGSHRVGLDHPAHRQAVRTALLEGCNLLDTSPSFALGDSERLLGEVVGELCAEGRLDRDSLLVITKVGLALGSQAEQLEERRKKEGELAFTTPLNSRGGSAEGSPHDISLESGAFSLDPQFLREQIQASRQRLGLEHLDFCLIQSPEHLLSAGKSHKELEQALGAAFALLESEVKAGSIGAYGILSNTFVASPTPEVHIDLRWVLDIAESVSPHGHHLQLIELPVNLVQSAALQPYAPSSLLNETKPPSSFAQFAVSQGLAVLAVRPLSSIVQGALLRLVDPPKAEDGGRSDALNSKRYKVAALEAEFETTFAPALRLSGKIDQKAVLPLSGPLGKTMEQMQTREQFTLAEATMLTPKIRQLLGQLDRAFAGPGEESWRKFRTNYVQAVGAWLAAVRETATDHNREFLQSLTKELPKKPEFSAAVKQDLSHYSWAQRALYLVSDAPAISGVLVGLRSPQHVEEALGTYREL